MAGIALEDLLDVGHRAGHVLPRQAEHEIAVECFEAAGARVGDGSQRLTRTVDTPEGGQTLVVETLDAQRQAVDPGGAQIGEAGVFSGAGVSFQGDLAVCGQTEPVVEGGQHPGDGVRRKQARRAAAEEHALDGPAFLGRGQRPVGQQGVDIGVLRQARRCPMRVEVAVGAFAHAPGQVDIGRQRHGVAPCDREVGRVSRCGRGHAIAPRAAASRGHDG